MKSLVNCLTQPEHHIQKETDKDAFSSTLAILIYLYFIYFIYFSFINKITSVHVLL